MVLVSIVPVLQSQKPIHYVQPIWPTWPTWPPRAPREALIIGLGTLGMMLLNRKYYR